MSTPEILSSPSSGHVWTIVPPVGDHTKVPLLWASVQPPTRSCHVINFAEVTPCHKYVTFFFCINLIVHCIQAVSLPMHYEKFDYTWSAICPRTQRWVAGIGVICILTWAETRVKRRGGKTHIKRAPMKFCLGWVSSLLLLIGAVVRGFWWENEWGWARWRENRSPW